jgi:hypothetical protein
VIGTQVTARGRIPWTGIVFLLIGAGFVFAYVQTRETRFALIAALPLLIAAAFFLTRERGFFTKLTAEGLELDSPPWRVAYGTIRRIYWDARGRADHFGMTLDLGDSSIRIPANLNVSSRELHDFLDARVPGTNAAQLPSDLAGFLQAQQADFGADRVWHFSLRERGARQNRLSTTVAVAIAISLSAVIWFVYGIAVVHNNATDISFVFFGPFLLLVAALVYVIGTRHGALPKSVRRSPGGLVIAPAGLALVQGKVQGQLRWDELRNVIHVAKPRPFSLNNHHNLPGLWLDVDGASIQILDVYDKPPHVIHRRILAVWKGPGGSANQLARPT